MGVRWGKPNLSRLRGCTCRTELEAGEEGGQCVMPEPKQVPRVSRRKAWPGDACPRPSGVTRVPISVVSELEHEEGGLAQGLRAQRG